MYWRKNVSSANPVKLGQDFRPSLLGEVKCLLAESRRVAQNEVLDDVSGAQPETSIVDGLEQFERIFGLAHVEPDDDRLILEAVQESADPLQRQLCEPRSQKVERLQQPRVVHRFREIASRVPGELFGIK